MQSLGINIGSTSLKMVLADDGRLVWSGVRAHEGDFGAAAKKLLEEGSDVLIFPEGSRSPDGTLQPLEGGAGLIAAHSKASILPVYVKGTYKAMPPGSPFIRPTKVTVTFGKLLSFDPEFLKTKDARRKITEELENSLRSLEASCS